MTTTDSTKSNSPIKQDNLNSSEASTSSSSASPASSSSPTSNDTSNNDKTQTEQIPTTEEPVETTLVDTTTTTTTTTTQPTFTPQSYYPPGPPQWTQQQYQPQPEFTQQHYDQFSFGFTPAFGFGYNGNGSVDYAALQAAQQGSNLNPQSNQWTPSTAALAATPAATAGCPTGSSTSPGNTTTSSNDTTSSVPSSTANSDSSASNSKWMQVIQDPLAVHEFNHTFQHPQQQQQQLSPGDMYQNHYPTNNTNYRSHHYPNNNNYRSQQPQHIYHHYQYNNNNNNLYQMQPHYGSQYVPQQQQNQVQHHHYNNQNKYNKYNYQNYNNGYNNNNNNDSNNNSRKSSNLNNPETSSAGGDKIDIKEQELAAQEQYEHDTETTEDTEVVSESNGSKSWASIVGVPNTTTTVKTKGTMSPQEFLSNNNNEVDAQIKNNNNMNYQSNNNNEYYPSNNNYSKYPRQQNSNYSKVNNSNNKESSQQVFDVTSLSFPPIGADIASIKAELSECSKQQSVDNKQKMDNNSVSTSHQSESQNYNNSTNGPQGQHYYAASKKQQQYNNYQRQQQQQFNLPIGPNYYSNGGSGSESPVQNPRNDRPRDDRLPKGDFYSRRHQPAQHTLSSFLNIIDKTKFNDKKDKSRDNNPTKTEQVCSSGEANTNVIDCELSAQTEGMNLDGHSPMGSDGNQLVVYTNPGAYNPKEFNTSPKAARFFVIKSYSEDDIHRSIKYNIWCSTEHGNRRLDSAYFKGDGQVPVYLFFSVNGSGHFCGMAEMQSRVDYNKITGVWSQDKWRGCFQVKWIYVKDVPNSLLRNIKLENNDNKPVTNSRDTQEIPYDKGRQVLKVFHTYSHSSSILDDFEHYERKQEEGKAILKAPHNNYEESNSGMTFVDTNYQLEQNEIINNTDNNTNEMVTAHHHHQEETKLPENNLVSKTVDSTVSVTSSPTASSSSSSTSSIDEAKQQENNKIILEQPQQVISSSS